MNKNTVLIGSWLLLTSCYPADNQDKNSEFVPVSLAFWKTSGNSKPYPFTAEYGEISCTMDRVLFYPYDTANDEVSIGWALNNEAQEALTTSQLVPTMTNPIRTDADLSEAIAIGLAICERNSDQKLKRIKTS